MTTFTIDTLLTRNPDLIATDMDGDTVMMSIERGAYYGVAGVGSRVWELLAQPATIAQMAPLICAEFEVDELTCRADLQKFVQDLLTNGLVSPV
jgi:hypothetical protein